MSDDWVFFPPEMAKCEWCEYKAAVAFGVDSLLECNLCHKRGCNACVKLWTIPGDVWKAQLLCPDCVGK